MNIALISEVFAGDDAADRLRDSLGRAVDAGADLAVLPELPLNPWSPATRTVRDDDAEPPDGPRARTQAEAAAAVGIGLVGGAIVIDPHTGRRHNTALAFDRSGVAIGAFRKLHVPEEPGFRETSHYDPGDDAAAVIDGPGIRFGMQICSDINRPEGCHLLGAGGAELVVAPRATELATYDRWRIVFLANALTSCLFVASVNRPRPEQGVLIGGPSIVVAPDGEVLLETTERIGIATIDPARVQSARTAYPGYLPVRADLYAAAWSSI